MNKRGLFVILLLFSLSLVSAQMGIGDFLDAFGGENILLIGSFIISFAVINFALNRLPLFKYKSDTYPFGTRTNKSVPGVIAFIISSFIVVGINRFDFDLSGFFFNYGVGAATLETIAVLVILAALIFLFWKFKSLVFLFTGILFISLSFTDYVYEKDILLFIGIVLVFIWILIKLARRGKGKRKKKEDYEDYFDEGDRKEQKKREKEYEKQKKREKKEKRKKTPRREANFYLSFRSGEELIFGRGESEKRFRLGNKGGGRIKWNAHALPTKLIRIVPNKGVFGPGQTREAAIQINRRAIPPQTPTPIKAAIGIHTLDRKRNKATFSARVKIY